MVLLLLTAYEPEDHFLLLLHFVHVIVDSDDLEIFLEEVELLIELDVDGLSSSFPIRTPHSAFFLEISCISFFSVSNGPMANQWRF